MTTPFKFQEEGVRQIDHFGGRALLAWEMGTGKTFGSLLWASRHPEARPIVVVCPASVKWVWRHEAAAHFGWHAEILEGTRPPDGGLDLENKRLIVINYDILGPWLERLERIKPGMLIIDECQYLQSRSTKRTKAVKRLARRFPWVLALSGMPLVNRPAELWATLNILRPDLFPSFFPFGIRYAGGRKMPWAWEFKGQSNTEELHSILTRNLMSRIRKRDVLADLPPKQRSVVPLEIEDRRQYEKATGDFLAWIGERMPSRLSGAERAQALVKIGYLKRLAAELKLESVFAWTDDFLQGSEGKLILFAVHKKIIAALRDRHAGICSVVDGSVTGRRRHLAIEKFLKHPKCRLFIGNVQAAGVGWSAKGVSDVAFCEFPWTPGAVMQAEDRAHGIGRGEEDKHTSVWFLAARETVEESLIRLLQRKAQTLSAVLDNGEGEDLDIFDRLCKELRKGNENDDRLCKELRKGNENDEVHRRNRRDTGRTATTLCRHDL